MAGVVDPDPRPPSQLLESSDFVQNRISTGWLDRLIQAKVQSDKPETIIATICTAVYLAADMVTKDREAYTR
jgi:acetyl-CoA carboxylase/biotin carboxylase 1